MTEAVSHRRAPAEAAEAAAHERRVSGPSTRLRILGWYMTLMAMALVVGLLFQRSLLLSHINEDVNAQLRQEVAELEQLSTGKNPNTGEPFGNDVAAIFDTFLQRNIPVEGEAVFTLIDGHPHASTVTPLQLLNDPAVVAEWSAITAPTQKELDTSAGVARYLAAPVLAEDGRRGVFVVANFLDAERSEVNQALQVGGVVYGSIFVIASIAAWFVAGRILRPVRLLTETARSIKDDNWSQRIPVKGDHEIARLTETFNDMLDRLETAFVMQRRFIDDAGHELRTPITIIRGHLEVMGNGAEEREETKHLLLDELDRMSHMVEDLLLLARAEQPDFLDLHPLDVSEFTNEVAAKVSGLSTERKWDIGETAPAVVVADRQKLTQALMNLVRNAVEHSEEGSRITLGSRYEGDMLSFWVQDEGEGISRADQERIFDRFSRGRGGKRSGGAGLGLAIVKTIAEAHGGRVDLTSERGTGSTFSLSLPLQGPEAAG